MTNRFKMPAGGIPLRGAPEQICDIAWAEYVRLYPDPQSALRHLSHRDPGILVYTRSEAARVNPASRAAAAAADLKNLWQERIIAHLRREFTAGRLIARGLHIQTAEEKDIPKALLETLVLDFENNAAEISDQRFERILVRFSNSKVASEFLTGRAVAWLKARNAKHGREKKDALQGVAARKFGPQLHVRDFKAAYAHVYPTQGRGRPRAARARKKNN